MPNTSPYGAPEGGDPSHTPYYTVAQVARRLQVSPSTIWRWIDAKKLPAYRVGEKTIRVRSEDLDALLRPTHTIQTEVSALAMKEHPTNHADHTNDATHGLTGPRTTPLTAEAIRQGLVAVRKAAASRAEQLARRGGTPFPSSVDLIREIREELSARQ